MGILDGPGEGREDTIFVIGCSERGIVGTIVGFFVGGDRGDLTTLVSDNLQHLEPF
jgi:hypothetical protein